MQHGYRFLPSFVELRWKKVIQNKCSSGYNFCICEFFPDRLPHAHNPIKSQRRRFPHRCRYIAADTFVPDQDITVISASSSSLFFRCLIVPLFRKISQSFSSGLLFQENTISPPHHFKCDHIDSNGYMPVGWMISMAGKSAVLHRL